MVDSGVQSGVQSGAQIERVRPEATAAQARVALFDFDGTISTIRSGWIDVMAPMMVEILMDLKSGETEAELDLLIREMVWRTTGKETIYQMMDFAALVSARGGTALEPLQYKKMYLDRLWERIVGRIEDLKQEKVAPEVYMVPGARAMLEALRERGLKMYLASGTDEIYMREEARLLGVAPYFDGGVFGARDDYSFSKKILIQSILSGTDVRGEEIVGFGDGYVEIEETETRGRRHGGSSDQRAGVRRGGRLEAAAPDRCGGRLCGAELPGSRGSDRDIVF